ncbi:MAG: hypothetical protein WAO76_06095 [Georgfuchsia sp.]
MERAKQLFEGVLLLPERWQKYLSNSGETGMGYQTGNITLKDGSVFTDVAFINPYVTEIRGRTKGDFPFTGVISRRLSLPTGDGNGNSSSFEIGA